MVESLEVLKKCGDVTLKEVVSGYGEDGLGLDWMEEVFFNHNDSLIL